MPIYAFQTHWPMRENHRTLHIDAQNGSKTIRPRQIRLWSFGLLICGWGLWVGVFRFLGLGRVLGTNSHGFTQNLIKLNEDQFIMTGNKMEAISWLTSGFYYTVRLAREK